jgi:hypothetical protein
MSTAGAGAVTASATAAARGGPPASRADACATRRPC